MRQPTAAGGTPLADRPLKSIEKEAGLVRTRHPLAPLALGQANPGPRNVAGERVDDKSHPGEPLAGRDRREIGRPEHIRPGRPEPLVHLVPRTGHCRIADRRLHRPAADSAGQTHPPHQPSRRAAGNRDPLAPQLPHDLAHPVDPEILLSDPADFRQQPRITPRAGRQEIRIGPAGNPRVTGRRRDRQHPANLLDPGNRAMRVDERDHGFDRRSRSANAKMRRGLAQDFIGPAQIAVHAFQRLDPRLLRAGRSGTSGANRTEVFRFPFGSIGSIPSSFRASAIPGAIQSW